MTHKRGASTWVINIGLGIILELSDPLLTLAQATHACQGPWQRITNDFHLSDRSIRGLDSDFGTGEHVFMTLIAATNAAQCTVKENLGLSGTSLTS